MSISPSLLPARGKIAPACDKLWTVSKIVIGPRIQRSYTGTHETIVGRFCCFFVH
jgi:hypothetical protein